MLSRLKAALVNSYIGAIATGWLLADGLYGVAGLITKPFELWYTIHYYRELLPTEPLPSARLALESALNGLIGGVVRLLLAFLLIRWLYWERPQSRAETPEDAPKESA